MGHCFKFPFTPEIGGAASAIAAIGAMGAAKNRLMLDAMQGVSCGYPFGTKCVAFCVLAESAFNSEVAQDARIIPRLLLFLRENPKKAPIRDSCLLYI
jgi:hypothetical protein